MRLLRWAKQAYNQQTPAEDENKKVKHKKELPYRYEENPPKQQRHVMVTVEDRIDYRSNVDAKQKNNNNIIVSKFLLNVKI